ncbi:hypothetical protein TNCV_4001921 [Trichonephila clavipes]|uniref:Uncharacterized protein n=1 Tax=Trichonephila clavipes TaxID=2585209 RepID=A0A8X6RP58_TRICX|nr:hypothetical protein TNCV_4001921 [Trichonephila clavipes]
MSAEAKMIRNLRSSILGTDVSYTNGAHLPAHPTESKAGGRNLHTCRFVQPYYGASSPLIRLATPLVWFIDLPTATIITIFPD